MGERLNVQVRELDERIAYIKKSQNIDAKQRHEAQLEQRLQTLDAQHERRKAELADEYAREQEELAVASAARLDELHAMHLAECERFVDNAGRIATTSEPLRLGEGIPDYISRHNASSGWKNRRVHPDVSRFRAQAKRLRAKRR